MILPISSYMFFLFYFLSLSFSRCLSKIVLLTTLAFSPPSFGETFDTHCLISSLSILKDFLFPLIATPFSLISCLFCAKLNAASFASSPTAVSFQAQSIFLSYPAPFIIPR